MKRTSLVSLLALLMFAAPALAQESGGIAIIGGDAPKAAEPAALPAPQVTAQQAVVGVAAPPQRRAEPPKRPTLHAKIPPATVTVRSNINERFAVALYHANRILTPFRNPEIQTSSTAGISIEQGIVYVTTDRPDPIAMFVYDRADPSTALSLTLIPQEINPVSTRVEISGYSPALVASSQYARDRNPSLANTFETEEAYVATLKNLFKGLALGKVPSGYGLQALQGRHPLMPACNIPGVQVLPMQILEGHDIVALVAKATNYGYMHVEFSESACRSPGVLATAAWPSTTLAPGQSVEVYIALKAPSESDGMADRPSVLGGR